MSFIVRNTEWEQVIELILIKRNNMKEYPKKLCEFCKERNVNCNNGKYSERCVVCTFKKDKEKRKINYEIRTYEIICKKCGNKFKGKKTQKYCQNPCEYSELKKNHIENWLNKKEVRIGDNKKVAYSFFKKKYGPGKQYQACRG